MNALNVPTAKEAIAVQLHHQGRTMAQIEANTGLGREEILAAVERDAAERLRNPTTPPRPGPAPKEHLRRPIKQSGKPVDRDEQIRVLKGLIEVLHKQLAKYEAELAELLGTTPAPAPLTAHVPEPATAPAPAPGLDLAGSARVRDWAIAAGWAVPAAGEQLPGAIVLAYLKAHGGNQ